MTIEKHLKAATVVTQLLDNQFSLFGHKFGLNGVIGTVIPEIGDLIIAIVSFYLVWIGIKMDLPKVKIAEMIYNVLLNFTVGLVPILGDALDFFHKANLKNLRILSEYAEKRVIEGEIIHMQPK